MKSLDKILWIIFKSEKEMCGEDIAAQSSVLYKTVLSNLSKISNNKSFKKYITYTKIGRKKYYSLNPDFKDETPEKLSKILYKHINNKNRKYRTKKNKREGITTTKVLHSSYKPNKRSSNEIVKDSIRNSLPGILESKISKLSSSSKSNSDISVNIKVAGNIKILFGLSEN